MSKKSKSYEPLAVHGGRFLVADERHRAPGLRHELEHGLKVGKGQDIHVSTSVNGFGRMRWVKWDESKIYYEIEGRPEGLSFEVKVVTIEGE